MTNPYWHPEHKPHVVDLDEVRPLYFEIYNLVLASAANKGDGVVVDDEDESPEFPSLEQLRFEVAENE